MRKSTEISQEKQHTRNLRHDGLLVIVYKCNYFTKQCFHFFMLTTENVCGILVETGKTGKEQRGSGKDKEKTGKDNLNSWNQAQQYC
jgi:hypothetical protein